MRLLNTGARRPEVGSCFGAGLTIGVGSATGAVAATTGALTIVLGAFLVFLSAFSVLSTFLEAPLISWTTSRASSSTSEYVHLRGTVETSTALGAGVEGAGTQSHGT